MSISKTIRNNLIVGGAFIVAPCMIGAMAGLAALTYRGDGGNWIFALGLAMVWAGLLWPQKKEPKAERFSIDEWEEDEDGVRFHGAGPDGRRGSFRVERGSAFTVTNFAKAATAAETGSVGTPQGVNQNNAGEA